MRSVSHFLQVQRDRVKNSKIKMKYYILKYIQIIQMKEEKEKHKNSPKTIATATNNQKNKQKIMKCSPQNKFFRNSTNCKCLNTQKRSEWNKKTPQRTNYMLPIKNCL